MLWFKVLIMINDFVFICAGYLHCVANILPNGDKVLQLLYRDGLTSNCQYPLYYHLIHGFSECAPVCANNLKFCENNCPGNAHFYFFIV